MGKPRQRPTDIEIIDRPELKSSVRNFTEGSLTFLLWGIWIYFLLPFFTFLLWLLGFRIFYLTIFTEFNFNEFVIIFKNGIFIILSIFFIQISWIYYNCFIFIKRGDRRKNNFICPKEKIANFFGIDLAVLEESSKNKVINVSLKNKKIIIKKS